MDSKFGEFITKEYGLLRQILSYLEPCDLLNARHVCRAWNSAVDSLIEKNPCIVVCSNEDEIPNIEIPKTIITDLVIHQSILVKYELKCKLCQRRSFVCLCKFSHPNSIFISLYTSTYKAEAGSEDPTQSYLFSQSSSLLILPTSSKLRVSTFVSGANSPIYKKPVTNDVVNHCIGEDPIKCLLIISRTGISHSSKRKWINDFITQVVQRQGMTFALGGGIINATEFHKGCPNSRHKSKKSGLILIALRGDNITACSELLSKFDKQSIEDSISQLGRTVGPVPKNATRLAFISQCVDRIPVESIESSAFRRTFPEVPQLGFQAYGEFGIQSSSCVDSSRRNDMKKKIKFTFDHSRTTSFVILTFSKM